MKQYVIVGRYRRRDYSTRPLYFTMGPNRVGVVTQGMSADHTPAKRFKTRRAAKNMLSVLVRDGFGLSWQGVPEYDFVVEEAPELTTESITEYNKGVRAIARGVAASTGQD
jgi:hypothetical protein